MVSDFNKKDSDARLNFLVSPQWIYPLLIIALVFSPRVFLGGEEGSKYLSLNLEDVVILLLFTRFTLRKLLGVNLRIHVGIWAVSLSLLLLTGWLVTSTFIGLIYLGFTQKWLISLLWLFKWLEYFVLFFIAQDEIKNSETGRWSLRVFLSSGWFLSFVTVYSLVKGVLLRRLGTSYGIGELFFNPNTAGSFFVIFGLMFLSFLWFSQGNLKKIILSSGFFLSVIGLVVSGSRSAGAAFVVGLITLIIFRKGPIAKKLSAVVGITLLVSLSLFSILNYVSDYQITRWTKIFVVQPRGVQLASNFASHSIKERLSRLERGWSLFKQSPVLGRGYFSTLDQYLDNQYIIFLVELGMIGFFFVLVFYYSIFCFLKTKNASGNPISLGTLSIFAALLVQSIAGPAITIPRIMGLLYLFIVFSSIEQQKDENIIVGKYVQPL